MSEAAVISRDIRGFCEGAGLTVDSVDGDAGGYTVCFWANGWSDRQIIDGVNAQLKRRDRAGGTSYNVRFKTQLPKPMERMVFRVVQP